MTTMPRRVDKLRSREPFPVTPGTHEYDALSFLVRNRDYGFTPTEISDRTDVAERSASKTLARLFDKGLVDRVQGVYFVDPDRAADLQRRLESIDAAARLHESAPDDAGAEPGWESQVPSLAPGEEVPAEDTHDGTVVADEVSELVARLVDGDAGAESETDD